MHTLKKIPSVPWSSMNDSDLLSNFYACNIKLQVKIFKSGEHAYQWMKASSLGRADLADKIQLAETPRESKQIVESLSQTESFINGMQWLSMKLNYDVYDTCYEKYDDL